MGQNLVSPAEKKEFSVGMEQQFDGYTTATQVLYGRDLGGKVAIVTGANCGIGYETAKALAHHGCEVYLACRNKEATIEAMKEICMEKPDSKVHYLHLDLANFKSIQEFCFNFEREEKPIHLLILNAGLFGVPFSLTEDGFESIFQVNHLGHFYMVKLLMPLLIKSAPSRIVVLSSESHRFSFITKDNISEERLSPKTANGYFSMVAYNNSKLCNILFSNELNRRLSPSKIFSYAVHPGSIVSSNISRNWWGHRLLFAISSPFTKSLAQAASTTVYCAVADELEGVGGMYLKNCQRCTPSKNSEDEDLAKLLWELSEKMIARTQKSNQNEDLN